MGYSSLGVNLEQEFELNHKIYPLVQTLPLEAARLILCKLARNYFVARNLINQGKNPRDVFGHQFDLLNRYLRQQPNSDGSCAPEPENLRFALYKILSDDRCSIPEEVKQEIDELIN